MVDLAPKTHGKNERFKPCTRWFKATFWFLGWRSLNLSKGLLTNPKRAQRLARQKMFFCQPPKTPPKKLPVRWSESKHPPSPGTVTQRLGIKFGHENWITRVLDIFSFSWQFLFRLGEKMMNFQMMMSAIGQLFCETKKAAGPGGWLGCFALSFVFILPFLPSWWKWKIGSLQ